MIFAGKRNAATGLEKDCDTHGAWSVAPQRKERGEEMKAIKELLEEARFHIDGQVNCHTPEYAALDKLERALSLLVEKVERVSCTASQAANTASCLANGIQPD